MRQRVLGQRLGMDRPRGGEARLLQAGRIEIEAGDDPEHLPPVRRQTGGDPARKSVAAASEERSGDALATSCSAAMARPLPASRSSSARTPKETTTDGRASTPATAARRFSMELGRAFGIAMVQNSCSLYVPIKQQIRHAGMCRREKLDRSIGESNAGLRPMVEDAAAVVDRSDVDDDDRVSRARRLSAHRRPQPAPEARSETVHASFD